MDIIQLTTPVQITTDKIANINKHLARLDEEHSQLTKIESTADYDLVKQAIRTRVSLRTATSAKAKELKADALTFQRACIAEEKRIHGLILPEETRLRELKKVEDDRKEAIRAEKKRKDEARIRAIRAKIEDIQKLGTNATVLPQDQLRDLITQVENVKVTPEEYAELTVEANEMKHQIAIVLEKALGVRILEDEQAEERKLEAERLAKQKAEQDKKDAELAAAQKKIDDEKERIRLANEKLEADKKAEADRKLAEENAKRIAEEAKVKAEADAKAQAEREKKEAEDKAKAEAEEKARQEALRPDKEKMSAWVVKLRNMPAPHVEDSRMRALVSVSLDKIGKIADEITKFIEIE